ncbi:vacuolar protein sorting-associated protein 45-like [Oppia nitens]|uniref:vacuolar protein sorting-associated protein 45-like n=1 Tax=Oppia nitens TaxID=1686743 RepID=UPI0023DB6CD0|nr:vacuolar protein sorting-associated protein 45-like [Oppia nitens]
MTMDVIAAVKLYLNRMVEECGIGLKVLLMDRQTISIVSLVYLQSEMLQKEVYLFETLDNLSRLSEPMKYLKCITFVRPTQVNIDLLRQELSRPHFGQYHIFFSNIISKTDIKCLAEADECEVVKDVNEYYCDFLAISPHLFSININNTYHGWKSWNQTALQRSSEAIISVLLALKRNPTIRYQSNSELCKRLAESIRQTIAREGLLFDFRKSSLNHSNTYEPTVPPVLLILDRKLDPITPCLNQWTYEAQLHELLNINNNRINLSNVPGVKDIKEVVLSQEHDDFYQKNMYLNYGEICANIKQLMDEFQIKTKSQKKVESIADMKSFIETYPQFKKMSGTVTKHVTLIDELFRLVSLHNIFEVSEAEQELVCQSDRSESLKKVKRLISSEKIRDLDAMRLAMLFAIRFEKNSEDIQEITHLLKRKGISDKQIKLVSHILNFIGTKRQTTISATELLSTEHVKSFTKKMIKGLKGVENIYTQHSPVLKEILEDLIKGKLKEVLYPYLGTIQLRDKPQEIIVFMIGGTTYEESCVVNELNRTFSGVKILLGGTTVHNFKSFMDELNNTAQDIGSTTSGTISFTDRHRIL